ncbi:unnamed protein product [Candidula unifasciata]|uniref:RNA helicase n=1 Tax=Candidula unifasciata TaxID=100452 RepID=A0A8S4A883_9EUPU|nr:unnamed protein product [Candidula unifasciata]
MSQDKRGPNRGRGGLNQRGRSGYLLPFPNYSEAGFNSGFQREPPSPPPPYHPPYHPPPSQPPPYQQSFPTQTHFPPQPPFPTQPALPSQFYPTNQPTAQAPGASYITVAVTQMPANHFPTQEAPQSHFGRQQPPSTYFPREEPPQDRYMQPPASYHQSEIRGGDPAQHNPDYSRPNPRERHPSSGRYADDHQSKPRYHPGSRGKPPRNDHYDDRWDNSNTERNDRQQNQPHFRSNDFKSQPQNEPCYQKSGRPQNEPDNSRPGYVYHPQNRSQPLHTSEQNRPSHFGNERNPGRQYGNRSVPPDKVTSPPPLFQQHAPGRNRDRGDKQSKFSQENKETGEGRPRKKSQERNYPAYRSRLNSSDSNYSDRSESRANYQGRNKYHQEKPLPGSVDRNVPPSKHDSDVLNSVQGNISKEKHYHDKKARGTVNKPNQDKVSDHRDSARNENTEQGFKRDKGVERAFKGKVTAKTSPERKTTSDASSQESEESTSEVLGDTKDAKGQKKTRNRYRKQKVFMEKNKSKFQSMPDLNLKDSRRCSVQETESHYAEESKADNEATANNLKKKWNHKKKRPVKNPKQSDTETGKENAEVVSVPRVTKASIQIGKCFEDIASFKEVISQNIELSAGNSSLEFVEGSVICSERQGLGTILVTASSKQLSKRLVKGLCAKLRKELKVNVEYDICGVEENKQVKEDNSPAKGKHHNKSFLKTNDFTRRSMRKKVTEIFEKSSLGDEKQKTTGNKKIDPSKAKVGEELLAETKAERNKSNDDTWEDPTKISVSINRIFPRKEDVFGLVSSIVEDKTICIRLVPNSVSMAKTQTLCDFEVSRKENIRLIIEKLQAFEFNGVKVRCFVVADGKSVGKDSSYKGENMQEQIKESIEKIRKKTQTVLDLHETKIELLDNALKVMESSVYNEEDSDNFDEDNNYEQAAFYDKLKEVTRQREMFCLRRDQLIESVSKLEPLTVTIKTLTDLLQSVGVECERLKAALPIYARRDDIVKQVSQNQVSIILGETGSGKSTQMAQYIYEAGLAGQGLIVCTQPRKVAAVTLAERVAKEMADRVGNLVGYKTGMKKNITKDKTKIVFATDHCLLNECLADPTLSQYTCIIVDEAHERSIYTDLLLGMIKACLSNRPDLKVIITSATIDPDIFIRYFSSGPELRVSGRTFPVEVIYSKPDDSPEFENFEMKAVAKALEIHKNEDPGDILVFLTSPVEITRCCEEFEKCMTGRQDFKCFPLHGQLSPDEQRKVFQQLNKGIRKIVFATNCAETSITIDGIKYVIDTGVAKEMRYDGKKNICSLGTFVISKSSADQRKGRAGRTASGKCYRLFSEEGYKNMEVSSQPEILRVPLGQSVLKLAELGVDVKKYDFVEAPSVEAIESALSNLRDLGAISSEGITDVGRWISKLPLSPKEGFLVYHGNQKGLLYDSVVLASLIANGSNLFYRGMTESEVQISAKSKSLFGSIYGDVFTWLEVFKVWITIPPKEQPMWCKKNGINYKAINFARQFVKEVSSVLKNELGVTLENSFSSDESAAVLLRKILFDANVASVCHYLGHVRAGYYALVAERQVHLHPSSTLLSSNSQPEWIVYTEFTKTSRDFIKGITVVEEDWVMEAAKEGRLKVDINWVKSLKSVLVHREMVGPSVFRKLVGARYSQLRVWEDELATAGMKAVVVEADYDLGTIEIFSTSPMVQDTIDSFATTKQETIRALQLEETEISILEKRGTEPSGARVLIGEGGCVKTLLLPDQSNAVLIKKAAHSTTEEEIRVKFRAFGEIKECVRFKRTDPWGFVRYSSFAEAQAAVDGTRKDEENCAVLKIDKHFKKMVSRFEARLSWCRRPIKASGTAFIKCPPIEKASLVGRRIYLPSGSCELQVSRRGDELVCFKTGQAQEMEIKKRIIEILDYDESLNQNIQVSVLREKVEPQSQGDINTIKESLAQSFSKYARDKFNINILPAKGNAINQVAFIHFENPTDGFQACSWLKGLLDVAGQSVEISPSLKTTLHVSKAIMNVCKNRFDEIIKGLEEFKQTNVHIRPLKQGDFAFDIKSENVKSMVEARELLQRELEGEVIDCTANNLVRKFLKQQGKEALKKIESMLDVLIVVNERREQIHIYGSVAKVNETQVEINRYLSKLAEGKQVDVFLKGPNKPAGLMKEVIKKYGSLQDDLVQQFSLTDVVIDFRQQKLSIFGPVECVDNAVHSISELAESLSRPGVERLEKELPDCVVCMCPVEHKSELYRLEACGHSYCLSCLKLQITVSVQDKTFPIICSEEHCGKPLVWKDLCFCIKKQWTSEQKLMDKSVNAFVASNPKKYKFCLTPECPVIYEVTTDEAGCEFNCPSCLVSLCTSCHTAYHAGLTCRMSTIEEEAARQLKQWVQGNPSQRKWCPKCKIGVEKTEGCNRMNCTSCRTCFCWVCLAIVADEQECYRHLMKEHGGFY